MENATREIRIAQWTKLVEACQSRPAGMTMKQWLADNNINEKCYYYRQKIVRRRMIEAGQISVPAVSEKPALSFAEISVGNSMISNDRDFKADAVITTDKLSVSISNTVSDRLLSAIISEVMHAI